MTGDIVNKFLVQLIYAQRTGLCPVCHRRPRARWKDTEGLRMTCGHPECFKLWLPGKRNLKDNTDVFSHTPIQEEVVIDG